MGTPDNKILVSVAWAVDGIIRCGIAEKPVALEVLASGGAHNVGLGVPELGLCKGLTELLSAFKSEFGAVEVFRDKVVGPKRPSPVSPRPAEAKISRLGHARPAGQDVEDGLVAMVTPLLSSPRRHFRASYIFKAFRSTLFTITDLLGCFGFGLILMKTSSCSIN